MSNSVESPRLAFLLGTLFSGSQPFEKTSLEGTGLHPSLTLFADVLGLGIPLTPGSKGFTSSVHKLILTVPRDLVLGLRALMLLETDEASSETSGVVDSLLNETRVRLRFVCSGVTQSWLSSVSVIVESAGKSTTSTFVGVSTTSSLPFT
jgi:hypothetical protein